MSIRRTLWFLPVVSTVIFAVGLSVSAYLTTRTLSTIKATEAVDYPVLEASSALIADVQSVTAYLKSAITEGEKDRLQQAEEQANAVRARIKRLDGISGQQPMAARLAAQFEDYYVPAKAGTQWMMGIAAKDEKASVSKAESALKVLESDLVEINQSARKQFAAGIERSAQNVQKLLNSTIISALVVTLSLIGISHLIVRSVWARLGGEPEYVNTIAAGIAAGDLSMDIVVQDKDGKSLLAAIKRMKETLEATIGDIKNSASIIRSASADIAAGNADLSSRTELQASSLQETASSMEEMTETVAKNVEHSVNASKMSDSASDVAGRGGRAVSEAVATMEEINSSAKRIADIIGVIDGIAFQTNILALNAAVEAARAGEQGRGFAVVATEVRALAQRSASAAREIKELINDSVSKVDAGMATVSQAGTIMTEIVTSVKSVADIMTSITTASQEQRRGIDEINTAVTQMDAMTQQNAAMVEQASAAAISLEEQVEALNRALSMFRLSSTPGNVSSVRLADAGKQRAVGRPAERIAIPHA